MTIDSSATVRSHKCFYNEVIFLSFCADTTYQVTFKTGDRPNAGTTAKVQFELFGDNGKTEAIQLSEDRSLRLFERGNSDKFKVDTRDVGKVCIESTT